VNTAGPGAAGRETGAQGTAPRSPGTVAQPVPRRT